MAQQKTSTRTIQATHTEMGNVYFARHMNDAMFTRGGWYTYSNGIWEEINELILEHDIWSLLQEFEASNRIKPQSSIVNSVMRYLRSRFYIPDDQIDAFPTLVNLKNGVYSLEDNALFPHKPDYYMTTQLPFEYNPKAKTNLWQLYLDTTFVHPHDHMQTDPELIEFLQEAIGYSLTSSTEHQVMFWCYGSGANGKGVLFHILEKLVGDAFFPLNIGMLRRDLYQLAELPGKVIAACSEASATDNVVDDAHVKMLVSGDTMTARSPHKRPFDLHPQVKLWWSMNRLPTVADSSKGFWRRVRVLPFHRCFEGKGEITDLKTKLENELPAIFNWAMQGLRNLRSRGKFNEPAQIVKITEEYRREQNKVLMFVEECCKEVKGVETQAATIFRAYREWCTENNYRPFGHSNFKRELEDIGFAHKRTSAYNVYCDIQLKIAPFP